MDLDICFDWICNPNSVFYKNDGIFMAKDEEKQHPKDIGLRFPRFIKPKKPKKTLTQKKPLSPISQKRKKQSWADTIPEAQLQKYWDQRVQSEYLVQKRYGDEFLKWMHDNLFENPAVPDIVKSQAYDSIVGEPDSTVHFPLDGTPFELTLTAELKRDHPLSKLNRNQRLKLAGRIFHVPRTHEQIDELFDTALKLKKRFNSWIGKNLKKL